MKTKVREIKIEREREREEEKRKREREIDVNCFSKTEMILVVSYLFVVSSNSLKL